MIEKILSFDNENLILSVLVIIIGILFYLIVKNIANRYMDKRGHKIDKKKKTYIKLINSIIKYAILIFIVVLVLKINGVNVTSIVAGLGLISIIAGLALQDALKDIIMGLNIIIDGYFVVGDVIKYGDTEGKITEIGLKVTKMKDINNGNIYVIANRNISEALNLSDQLDIDIPIPYNENTVKIEKIIEEIKNTIKHIKDVKSVEYKGINKFGDSAVFYKLFIFAKPEDKPQIKREANRIIKMKLDENNVEIPFMQIDIHTK